MFSIILFVINSVQANCLDAPQVSLHMERHGFNRYASVSVNNKVIYSIDDLNDARKKCDYSAIDTYQLSKLKKVLDRRQRRRKVGLTSAIVASVAYGTALACGPGIFYSEGNASCRENSAMTFWGTGLFTVSSYSLAGLANINYQMKYKSFEEHLISLNKESEMIHQKHVANHELQLALAAKNLQPLESTSQSNTEENKSSYVSNETDSSSTLSESPTVPNVNNAPTESHENQLSKLANPEITSSESIHQLLKVLKVKEQNALLMNEMFDTIEKSIPPEERELFEHLKSEMVDGTGLIEQIVPIYQKHLTQREVDSLIQFYSTVEGQRFITKQPEIMKESMTVGQKWSQEKILSYKAQLNEGIDFKFTKNNTFVCDKEKSIVGTTSYVKLTTSMADVSLRLYNANGSENSNGIFFGSIYDGNISGLDSIKQDDGLLYQDDALYISMKKLFTLSPTIQKTIEDGGYFEIQHSENLSQQVYYVSSCLVAKESSGIDRTLNALKAEADSISEFTSIQNRPFNINSNERLITGSHGWEFQGIDIYKHGKIIQYMSPSEMAKLGLISELTDYWLIHPEKFKSQSFWTDSDTIIVFSSRSHEAGNNYDVTGSNLQFVEANMQDILKDLPEW